MEKFYPVMHLPASMARVAACAAQAKDAGVLPGLIQDGDGDRKLHSKKFVRGGNSWAESVGRLPL
jgi:hypothetical protein